LFSSGVFLNGGRTAHLPVSLSLWKKPKGMLLYIEAPMLQEATLTSKGAAEALGVGASQVLLKVDDLDRVADGFSGRVVHGVLHLSFSGLGACAAAAGESESKKTAPSAKLRTRRFMETSLFLAE
jgi:hypothetical protein